MNPLSPIKYTVYDQSLPDGLLPLVETPALNSIPKKQKQLTECKELLNKLENMTLTEWLEKHKH